MVRGWTVDNLTILSFVSVQKEERQLGKERLGSVQEVAVFAVFFASALARFFAFRLSERFLRLAWFGGLRFRFLSVESLSSGQSVVFEKSPCQSFASLSEAAWAARLSSRLLGALPLSLPSQLRVSASLSLLGDGDTSTREGPGFASLAGAWLEEGGSTSAGDPGELERSGVRARSCMALSASSSLIRARCLLDLSRSRSRREDIQCPQRSTSRRYKTLCSFCLRGAPASRSCLSCASMSVEKLSFCWARTCCLKRLAALSACSGRSRSWWPCIRRSAGTSDRKLRRLSVTRWRSIALSRRAGTAASCSSTGGVGTVGGGRRGGGAGGGRRGGGAGADALLVVPGAAAGRGRAPMAVVATIANSSFPPAGRPQHGGPP